MLEATLFGYEKGAFTGAYQACPGKFEQAQGGTLLLDEISEMDLALQAKLLRVLQEKEVERLGGRKSITLDVRVLATSNRDLSAEVRAGRFRSDLFYRLNVFPLHLPPLQDRPGDILPLARRALASAARANGRAVPALSEAACARLLQHPWPGNVRELDNLMQRTLILQSGAEIHEEDLRFEPCSVASTMPAAEPCRAESLDEDLRSREEETILAMLRAVTGNRAAAAARLGISPRTLRYKLARMRAAGIAIPGENV
jgi:two-component system response regulator FlrC